MHLRVFLALLASLVAVGVSGAQTMLVPVEVQAPILLKVLRYDKGYETRAGEEAVLGVIFQSGFRDSLRTWEALEKILEDSGEELLGRPIRVVPLDLSAEGSLATSLRENGVDWAYVAPLRAVTVGNILAETQAAGVATLSGVPDYVEAGVAFGATQRDRRPAIMVNLPAARSEGLDFNANLLKLAVIVGRGG